MLYEAVGAGDLTLFSVKIISRSITSFGLFSLGLLSPGKASLFPPLLLPFLKTDHSSELQQNDSSSKSLRVSHGQGLMIKDVRKSQPADSKQQP